MIDLDQAECPYCGTIFKDAVKAVEGRTYARNHPLKGDIIACGGCAGVLVFVDDSGHLGFPSLDDWKRIISNKQMFFITLISQTQIVMEKMEDANR